MSLSIKKAGARYPLEIGDLVIWEEDPRFVCAYHLWVVVAHARGGPQDYPRKILLPVSAPDNKHCLVKKIIGASSELIPISAFGLVVDCLLHDGTREPFLKLRRDPSIELSAIRSDGKPLTWRRSHWDHLNYSTAINWDVVDLIADRLARLGVRNAA